MNEVIIVSGVLLSISSLILLLVLLMTNTIKNSHMTLIDKYEKLIDKKDTEYSYLLECYLLELLEKSINTENYEMADRCEKLLTKLKTKK